MQDLNVLCLQSDLVWDNPVKNREQFEIKILNHVEDHDLIILPETFTTGFPKFPVFRSEQKDGETLDWMALLSAKTGAVITGSLLLEQDGHFTNTLVWMRPDGSFEEYAKRHVFSMAGENKVISKGETRLIVELKGWKIMPMICYDLRFPVWSKNTFSDDQGYGYDLSLYIANWPGTRAYPWRQLLIARAIENLAYTIGVNRVGLDPNGISYSGDSMIIGPQGKILEQGEEGKERALTATLSCRQLADFRSGFDVGRDWDHYELITR